MAHRDEWQSRRGPRQYYGLLVWMIVLMIAGSAVACSRSVNDNAAERLSAIGAPLSTSGVLSAPTPKSTPSTADLRTTPSSAVATGSSDVTTAGPPSAGGVTTAKPETHTGKAAATTSPPPRASPIDVSESVPAARTPTIIRSLSLSAPTVVHGAAVTLSFTIHSGGAPVAQGDAAVRYGGVAKAVPLDDAGHATLALTDLAVGTHRIVVSYPGDETRQGASAPVTVAVTSARSAPSAGPVTTKPPAPSTKTGKTSPCPPTARACVDLANSVTWLQDGGSVDYGPVPITSGRPGLRTRQGTFRVFWKHQNHVSSIYGSPMPNSIFFDGGIAFHQGSLSEQSHGCVHLSWDASKAFWNFLRNGDSVYVWGKAPY